MTLITGCPLFSVLIASYQNGQYLDEALRSLTAQTYENWEAIVVDDASTDDTRDVLHRWKANRKIRILVNGSNLGVGASAAIAAEASKGELLGKLDGDDALTPNALEIMTNAHAATPETSLINSDLIICDENLRPIGKPSPYHAASAGLSLIRDCPMSAFAAFKRSAYERTAGFDRSLRRAVDHDMYLKLEEVGWLGYVPEPLYLYRTNADGISQGNNGVLAAQSALLARGNAYRRRRGTTIPNLTRKEYRALMSTFHRREAQNGHLGTRAALAHMARSAGYDPAALSRKSFWAVTMRTALRLKRG